MSKTHKKHDIKPAPAGPFASLSPGVRDILCVVFLYAVTLLLFRGIIFDNASFVNGGDTANAISYAHVGNEIQKTEGPDVLWMPQFFSGMPTFGPVAYVPRNINYIQAYGQTILNYLFLNGQWTWYILYFLIGGVSMFFLGRVLAFSRPAAMIAALTFMLSPYAIGLPTEGHGSKLMALSYLPLVFMLTHLLFQKRNFLSFGLLAAAIGTLMLTNHMQMVYYIFLVLGFYLLYTLIIEWKGEKILLLSKTGLFVGALVVGFAISAFVYLSVYEYAQFSMRGGGTAGSTGGLAYDYATNWSWSVWEMIVLLIPGFYGISAAQNPYYWGHVEPFNNSHAYIGLVPIVLAIFALKYRRNALTIFATILSLLILLMSFGRNGPYLYDAMFAVLPFFNKFRAPLMILHLLPFALGMLGAIGYEAVENLTTTLKDPAGVAKKIMFVAIGFGALFFVSLVAKSALQDILSGSLFLKDGEIAKLQQQYGAKTQQVIPQLKQLRFDIFWNDYLKFLILAALILGVIAAYLNKKLSMNMLGVALVGLTLVDLYVVDSKMIEPFPSAAVEQSFQMDSSVHFLKSQPGLFRIFPLGQTFTDNTYAYFGLQSLGGYSPAKLKIYQTMLDSCMYRGSDPQFPLNLSVINMMNAEYLLANGRLPDDKFRLVNVDQSKRMLIYKNPDALPRAFFVSSSIVAPTDHDQFVALNSPSFNPAKTAVLYAAPKEPIGSPDSTATAQITTYGARKIVISTNAATSGLLVLSEIYYPAGWTATVDGAATDILRTNYLLRSVVVPAGKHEVVFAFAPPFFELGWKISNLAWLIAAVSIVIGVWQLPAVRRRLAGTPKTSAEG